MNELQTQSPGWDKLSWQTRFVRQINFLDTDKCWEWTGSVNTGGYGTIYRHGNPNASHRLMWELCFGKPKGKLFICHRCDNRRCVNPSHLFTGTNKDNMQDMVRKGRKPIVIGDKNPNAKLTHEQIVSIREMKKSGVATKEVSSKFGIWPGHVWRICNGKAWAKQGGV